MQDFWRIEIVESAAGPRRLRIHADGEVLSAERVLGLLGESEAFRAFFSGELAGMPFGAFRWETPAWTRKCLKLAFECAVVEDSALGDAADRRAFAEHFGRKTEYAEVVAFQNLGGDATLVVPVRQGENSEYAHLAAFLRGAPEAQVHALWQLTAATMRKEIGDRPLWLSTAGLGVAWLHVRLDRRPKYYRYRPYTRELMQ